MKTTIKHIPSLFILLLAAVSLLSCSKETETELPRVKKLSVEKEEFLTPAIGGKHTINVLTENIEKWDFRFVDSWIECSREDGEDVITVTVQANELAEKKSAVITVYAEGVDDVTVTIRQEAGTVTEPDPVAQIIWDNNHRFFGKLMGAVASVDFVEDMSQIQLVEFDREGYVKSMTTDINGGDLRTTYDYDAQKRLSRIGFFNSLGQSIGMYIVVNYSTTHNNYVDIGHTFMGGLEFAKAFQPRFLRGVSSVVTTSLETGAYEVAYIFSGKELTVRDNLGNNLGVATYGDDGFVERQTNYLTKKQNEVEYLVNFHEVYDIDSETGKYRTITYQEDWSPVHDGEGTAYTTEPLVETYLDDKYNNKHKEGPLVEYTYDEFGDFLVITSPQSSDSYTYTRDAQNNWTRRVDNAVFMGEDYLFTDNRSVKYWDR